MYEEEKKSSFIKDFVIKLLYMFLFLFLFMWLYPAPKVDLSDVKVKAEVDKTELQPLFAGIYNNNITAMKDAARSYYTTDRLPKNNGQSSKMTLQEMLNKKIVAPLVDANGKACDSTASYVEVTRISATEYTMKVSLSCSDKKDYIIETIGCTSVCPGCVAAPTTTTTKVANNASTKTTVSRPTTTVSTPKPSTQTNNNNPQPTKIYKYEKTTETWDLNTDWTEEKKTGSDVKVVNTRTIDGETTSIKKTHTYRTVSWVTNSVNNVNYQLYLNNIPRDAKNIRITSTSRMINMTTTDSREYDRDRNYCNIQMVGSSCPHPGDSGVDSSTNPSWSTTRSFDYSVTPVGFRDGRFTVSVRATSYDSVTNNVLYRVPIKFTVQWTEESEPERIKQYQYSYLKKSTDTKYSKSNSDTGLLNSGYKLVGEV